MASVLDLVFGGLLAYFLVIFGTVLGPSGPLKSTKKRGGSIQRFCGFRFGSFSEVVLGSILEAFWAQKSSQNRAKNETKNESKFEGDFGSDFGLKKASSGSTRRNARS